MKRLLTEKRGANSAKDDKISLDFAISTEAF